MMHRFKIRRFHRAQIAQMVRKAACDVWGGYLELEDFSDLEPAPHFDLAQTLRQVDRTWLKYAPKHCPRCDEKM